MGSIFPYGLDAPAVVRNLAACAVLFWILFGLDRVSLLPVAVIGIIWPALLFSFAVVAMIWSSSSGKIRRRERLLDRLSWTGREQVLDVGCGRGLLAVAAARRAPHGHVTGVDIWQAQDLTGNGPEAVLANAQREGVTGRVHAQTADMRALPFDDGMFDIVVSSLAVHNIYQADGRDHAIDEIARVTKPKGQVLIDDIRHVTRYAARLREAGFELTVTRGARSLFWRLLSFGTLAPGTIYGRKLRG